MTDEQEGLIAVAWDYLGMALGSTSREAFSANQPLLRSKMRELGIAGLVNANKNKAAEIFGWLKERIMASLPPFSREVQSWINAEDTAEYNRRRRLVLEKLDQMKLRSIGEANEEQQSEIREWIAGNP